MSLLVPIGICWPVCVQPNSGGEHSLCMRMKMIWVAARLRIVRSRGTAGHGSRVRFLDGWRIAVQHGGALDVVPTANTLESLAFGLFVEPTHKAALVNTTALGGAERFRDF